MTFAFMKVTVFIRDIDNELEIVMVTNASKEIGMLF